VTSPPPSSAQSSSTNSSRRPKVRKPYRLFIDEFQNFGTSVISTILSESGKFGLQLVLAHQFLSQLDDEIRDAVLGNCSTIVSFRVGAEDAPTIGRAIDINPQVLKDLPLGHAWYRMLDPRGRPTSADRLPGKEHRVDAGQFFEAEADRGAGTTPPGAQEAEANEPVVKRKRRPQDGAAKVRRVVDSKELVSADSLGVVNAPPKVEGSGSRTRQRNGTAISASARLEAASLYREPEHAITRQQRMSLQPVPRVTHMA
jgi:hypothetical protein